MIPTRDQMFQALAERHGKAMQQKLQDASVAICGLGGLGTNTAIFLARAGVGRLHLIDFDLVDISNLNRQQYFPDQLGEPKASALLETIRRTAPYCNVTSNQLKLDEQNIPSELAEFDMICECFDKADQKAMLVNCVLEKLPEKYIVAASGMAGLGSANEIKTRRVTKRFFLCGDGSSDVDEKGSLFSSRVAVCAAHEANMVLRIIAGEYEA